MVSTLDSEYRATKRIKQGKEKLEAPLQELAEWIRSEWNVSVENIILDRVKEVNRPRLQVILDAAEDEEKFREGFNFDPAKQKAIATKYREILHRSGRHPSGGDGWLAKLLAMIGLRGNQSASENILVVFSAFEPIARTEATGKVTQKDVEALKKRIGNPELWEINSLAGTTFFFFTDEQMKAAARQGLKETYSRMSYDLIKPHDEFGYLHESEFVVAFDSKENFDKNFGGNWFHYSR